MKVLIIRFSSIGDIVLTTPVIRCIKEQTGATVHFLTKAGFAGLLSANPHVDRLWTIKKDISEVSTGLIAEGYDHVIDLHANLRTLELRARLSSNNLLHLHLGCARHKRQLRWPRPQWHAFNKLNLEKYLLVNLGVDRMPDVHIVDRYLATAAPLGIKNDDKGLDYFVPEGETVNLATEQVPTQFIVLVIGAAHATKRLTEEQMADFCAALPHPIVLLGGPAEAETGNRIAGNLPHVINACGRFKLGGSADLIRQATIVVTHDTGMMHVAAAYHKPILSVWGNTVPAFGMYPYLPGQEAQEKERRQEVVGLSCRPCSKIGYQSCPKGHFRCIKDQTAESLASAAGQLFSDSIGRP
ncbi:MAG: ADP-heptose:LPS heptosyltransferase [Neolewinella sp.]|jgi:ADP-heptose:LPS heptosyltransferase